MSYTIDYSVLSTPPTEDELRRIEDDMPMYQKSIDDIYSYFETFDKTHEYGEFLEELKNITELSEEEEFRLGKIYVEQKEEFCLEIINAKPKNEAEEAGKKLIDSNMPFLCGILYGYDFSRDDFVEYYRIGACALVQLLYMYDYKIGFRFRTYAIWGIKKVLESKSREKSSGCCILCTLRCMEGRISKIKALKDKLGRVPTASEIAAEVKAVSERSVEETIKWIEKDMTFENFIEEKYKEYLIRIEQREIEKREYARFRAERREAARKARREREKNNE